MTEIRLVPKMQAKYQALGLEVSATPEEVKMAWRRLAKHLHPDYGGDPQEFSRLRKIYQQVLADAEKPKLCDLCDGTGKRKVVHGWSHIEIPCHECKGTGKINGPS